MFSSGEGPPCRPTSRVFAATRQVTAPPILAAGRQRRTSAGRLEAATPSQQPTACSRLWSRTASRAASGGLHQPSALTSQGLLCWLSYRGCSWSGAATQTEPRTQVQLPLLSRHYSPANIGRVRLQMELSHVHRNKVRCCGPRPNPPFDREDDIELMYVKASQKGTSTSCCTSLRFIAFFARVYERNNATSAMLQHLTCVTVACQVRSWRPLRGGLPNSQCCSTGRSMQLQQLACQQQGSHHR